jgi:maleamate amidohydrolase
MAEKPGSLRLPPELKAALTTHLADLKKGYEDRGLGGKIGFGERPALLVIDFGKRWLDSSSPLGGDLESAVQHTLLLLDAAREAEVPIIFTTMGFGEDDPLSPWHIKVPVTRSIGALGSELTALDPRLQRRAAEKLIVKKYASAFRGTDLQEMLSSLGVDTLIVTGCSTSHCVTATCRDATSSFRVIVPEEAVGDRCELFQMVYLLDMAVAIGDVLPTSEVLAYLKQVRVHAQVL